MKKLIALVLALAMVAVVGLASAATITVTTPTDGTPAGADYTKENYAAYKIFDAVLAAGSSVSTSGTTQTLSPATGAIAYQITDDTSSTNEWFDVLFTVSNGTVTPKSGQTWVTASATGTANVYQISANGTSFDSADEAKLFAAWLLQNKGSITATYASLSEGANTVDDGYYLITSSLGTNLGLATTNIPMTIVEKNQYPGIDKTVASADEAAQIGSDVTFTLDVTVPNTADKIIYLTDTMSTGLRFKEIVSVKNNASTPADVTYTTHLVKDGAETELTGANVASNSNKFVIQFAAADVVAQKGKHIIVTYKATVTKDAVIAVKGTDANTNEVKLDYSNFSQTDTVGVDTVAITLLKYDGGVANAVANNVSLPGAVFELHNVAGSAISLVPEADDTTTTDGITYQTYHVADGITSETGTVTQFTTVANKVVRVKGLDPDLTYTWYEVSAPQGFNNVQAEISASIAADSVVSRTNVENNKGTVLPSTGGIGTTIFYILGGLLVVGAAVILVARRKASN